MKIGFSQTAEHRVNEVIGTDCFENLPKVIHEQTNLDYSCEQTTDGCLLKPSFRNVPFRNSFVPEIDIDISQDNGQTFLYMKGQPVKSVRIFMVFWFVFLIIMEMVLLVTAITSKLESLFPVFVPIVMCAFGYFLCRFATRFTFISVVKAIRKEYS